MYFEKFGWMRFVVRKYHSIVWLYKSRYILNLPCASIFGYSSPIQGNRKLGMYNNEETNWKMVDFGAAQSYEGRPVL